MYFDASDRCWIFPSLLLVLSGSKVGFHFPGLLLVFQKWSFVAKKHAENEGRWLASTKSNQRIFESSLIVELRK